MKIPLRSALPLPLSVLLLLTLLVGVVASQHPTEPRADRHVIHATDTGYNIPDLSGSFTFNWNYTFSGSGGVTFAPNYSSTDVQVISQADQDQETYTGQATIDVEGGFNTITSFNQSDQLSSTVTNDSTLYPEDCLNFSACISSYADSTTTTSTVNPSQYASTVPWMGFQMFGVAPNDEVSYENPDGSYTSINPLNFGFYYSNVAEEQYYNAEVDNTTTSSIDNGPATTTSSSNLIVNDLNTGIDVSDATGQAGGSNQIAGRYCGGPPNFSLTTTDGIHYSGSMTTTAPFGYQCQPGGGDACSTGLDDCTSGGPGGTWTYTATAVYTPLPPVAVLAGSYSATRAEPVTLDASNSTGAINDYDWTFTPESDCNGMALSNTFEDTGTTPSLTITPLCSLNVSLVVTDAFGRTDTTSTEVQVSPRDEPSLWDDDTSYTQVTDDSDPRQAALGVPEYDLHKLKFLGGENVSGCNTDSTLANPIICPLPDSNGNYLNNGYTIGTISDPGPGINGGGPFDRYQYIATTSFTYQAIGLINQYLVPGGPNACDFNTHGRKNCSPVDWYQENLHSGGPAFLAAIEGHEGLGYGGHANVGHSGAIEDDLDNNPAVELNTVLEAMFEPPTAPADQLQQDAQTTITAANGLLVTAASDPILCANAYALDYPAPGTIFQSKKLKFWDPFSGSKGSYIGANQDVTVPSAEQCAGEANG
jgi:hypothetical protein